MDTWEGQLIFCAGMVFGAVCLVVGLGIAMLIERWCK